MPRITQRLLPKKRTNLSSCLGVSYGLEFELGFYMPYQATIDAGSSSKQPTNKKDKKKPQALTQVHHIPPPPTKLFSTSRVARLKHHRKKINKRPQI
jgi:hypothetical protein